MPRFTRLAIGVTLATAMVLGAASTAFASPVLTLTPTKTSVVYPQPTWLKLLSTDGGVSVPATVTIQYRPIGTDTWKKLRSVASSRTAEGTVTVPVGPYYLRSITGFRAIAEGVESEVTTVSVKARLSVAKVPRVMRARRLVTVRGFIWPRHSVGSRPVEVTIWKMEAGVWVEKERLHPMIVGHTIDGSMWRFKRWIGSDDTGNWRMQVSHEDVKHAASTSRFSYLRVRRPLR